MRLILLLTCCALLPSLAPAQEYDLLREQHDRGYYSIKGTVTEVSEQQWLPAPDSLFYATRASFVPDNSYREGDSRKLAFDSSGNAVSVSNQDTEEGKKKDGMKSSRFYYQKGLLKACAIGKGDKTDSVVFQYRKNKLPDHYTVFTAKGDLQHKITYIYKNGKVATLRKNDKGNAPVGMIKYKYNGDQLLETQHFDDQYRLTETRRYSRQEAGAGQYNESFLVSGPDGLMKSGQSTIKDQAGHILELNVINDKREVTEHRGFVYDSQNQPVEEKTFSAFEELTVLNRYVYDDQGNWTRKEVFHNGQLYAVVLRQLKYR